MFSKLTVRARLISGFLLVAILGAIVAGIGIYNMSIMNAQAERAYKQDLLGISSSKEANINLIYVGRAVRSSLLATTPEDIKKFQDQADTAKANMLKQIETARPLFYTDQGRALLAEIDKGLADYNEGLQKLYELKKDVTPEGHAAALALLFGPLAKQADYVDAKLTELGHAKEKASAEGSANATNAYHDSRGVMITLVLLSVGAGICIGLFITRSLTRQLGGEPSYAAAVASEIADGQLANKITLRDGDQRSLLFAMETMRLALVKIVSQVRQGTDTIATASSQIAAGNLDLSSRTEEQASSLEETASSMEELTSTVKQNADNAQQANSLAVTASEVATRGGQVVAAVVDTMASINESSRKIVDIISVIDGIAFQTNILALNAAVEAARAGEQGRGFAVVASEVRNLAQRSAAAAKEIKTLIGDSVGKVEEGGKLVDQAGSTMTEIVESITRVTDIMSEISMASKEQTMGIEQINTAIAQMDEVTQQNAALVEEAAAAAGSLQEQASTLSEVVSVFKLGSGYAPATKAKESRPRTKAELPARPATRVPPKPLAVEGPVTKKTPPKANDDNWEEF